MALSRTRLALLTAVGLVILSAAAHVTRRATGGADVGPPGASSWEVMLSARGPLQSEKNSGIVTASPPDFRRQHVFDESWRSDELVRREGRSEAAKLAHEREALWKRRPDLGKPNTEYRLSYTFKCVLGAHHPTPGMHERTKELDAPPSSQALTPTARIQSDHREIADRARELAGDRTTKADQVRAFYDSLIELPPRETESQQTALDCLRAGGGDDAGRSRLLVALCRSREIPARVVTGMVLHPDAPPALHHWAEAWVHSDEGPEGHWLPVCPTYRHFGARKWPVNFLVVRLDDEPLVRAPGEPKVSLFARPLPDRPPADETRLHAFWRVTSFAGLPPAEQLLVRFLCLLPLAALVVSVFRVVIGVRTFGVFSPALLGLIFRDLKALPWGLGIFTATVLVGWLFRRVLDRFHLLLIPRAAVLLTLVIGFLLAVVVAASRVGVTVTGYVALFPLIILTHMVERFWTVEAEDGTRASFRTLLGTVFVATTVALVLSPEAVGRWMFRFPETLGVVVAALLLLGRYSGYRVTELYRFRDVIEFSAKDENGQASVAAVEAPEAPAAQPVSASSGT
ncbi:MAG TPA: 7TM domain-containing protein [Gemmataceae bacterium]|nr:7TM domain-containing protein [Gemmataceae bacterium]